MSMNSHNGTHKTKQNQKKKTNLASAIIGKTNDIDKTLFYPFRVFGA